MSESNSHAAIPRGALVAHSLCELKRQRLKTATVLAVCTTVLVIAGSQWGMVILSFVYATMGRTSLPITPELLLGTMALFLTLVMTTWFRSRFLVLRRNWLALCLLGAFVVTCCVSESLKSPINWRIFVAISTLFFYVIAGGFCGYFLGGRNLRTALGAIFLAFLLWHVGLAILGASGFLTLEKILVGARLPRLEVEGGFTATELPIFAGMQIPFVLMVIFSPLTGLIRRLAYVLLGANLLLLGLTASVGAIIASILVVFTFIAFGSKTTKLKSLGFFTLGGGILAAGGGFYFAELYFSVATKLDQISVGGGRAEIYSLLVETALRHPFTGIGKSNFQNINNFNWDGTGAYPHNNLLGIAAELGIIAAALYAVFVLVVLVSLFRAARELNSAGYALRSTAVVAAAGVVVYQQARGMLHDTWMIKELYFWIGFGMGLASVPIERVRISQDVSHEERQIADLSNSDYLETGRTMESN